MMSDKNSHNEFESLVPRYIREICQEPKTVEMRVNYDAPTCQTTYTYSVTWEDAIGTEEMYKKILERQVTNLPATSTSHSSKSTKGTLNTISTVSLIVPKFPSTNQDVVVKLVILESAKDYGVIYVYSKLKLNSGYQVKHVIKRLLKQKNRRFDQSGHLFYAELLPNLERKLRIVKKLDSPLQKFPLISDAVVFVLDMDDLISKGTPVYFQ